MNGDASRQAGSGSTAAAAVQRQKRMSRTQASVTSDSTTNLQLCWTSSSVFCHSSLESRHRLFRSPLTTSTTLVDPQQPTPLFTNTIHRCTRHRHHDTQHTAANSICLLISPHHEHDCTNGQGQGYTGVSNGTVGREGRSGKDGYTPLVLASASWASWVLYTVMALLSFLLSSLWFVCGVIKCDCSCYFFTSLRKLSVFHVGMLET